MGCRYNLMQKNQSGGLRKEQRSVATCCSSSAATVTFILTGQTDFPEAELTLCHSVMIKCSLHVFRSVFHSKVSFPVAVQTSTCSLSSIWDIQVLLEIFNCGYWFSCAENGQSVQTLNNVVCAASSFDIRLSLTIKLK